MSVRTSAASLSAQSLATTGTIEPTRLSIAYRAGLVVVAAAMLLLPLVYVAVIGAASAAVWWHLTTNVGLLDGQGGMQWRLIAYLAPAIVGVVVVFFMVKPLLARATREQDPLEVTADEEPILFDFVQQICRQVGAPLPRRVRVNCQVNASAGLLHGVFGRDLVLTIGLPLVAGLSIRELGGVLAHEFGHFAQGGGMRLTAIVRGINGWFARVVYERDAWDERLEAWSKRADWRLGAVLALARGAVWVSRRLLTGLMWTGHAISCFMMRQMEYDADSYEVKFGGSETFARTSVRLRELGAAAQFAYRDLRDGVAAGTIPSNLPAYVARAMERVPSEVAARLRAMPEGKTRLLDTHPSDADRLRAAMRIGGHGVLVGGDAPAAGLFSSFETLCATATRQHYEHDLGLDPGELRLVANEVAASHAGAQQERRRALQTLFEGCLSALRPIRLVRPVEDPLAVSKSARTRMRTLADRHLPSHYRRLEELESRRINAFLAHTLLDAGFTIDAAEFGLDAGTREEAAKTLQSLHNQQGVIVNTVNPFDEAAAQRLSAGLALASMSPAGAREAPGASGRKNADALADAGHALAAVVPHLLELRPLFTAAALLEANKEGCPDAARLRACQTNVERRIEDLLRRVEPVLAAVPTPESASGGDTTLAMRCGLSPATSAAQAPLVVDRAWSLYFDLLGRAARLTLDAEASMV